MKKVMVVSLAILACCVPGIAQNTSQDAPSAFETYAKARRTLKKFIHGEATPHYSLAAVTRRLDDSRAQVDFVVVGQMAGYTLEIQPLNVARNSNGIGATVAAGELATLRQPEPNDPSTPNPISEATVIIPTGQEANAVAVKWTAKGAELSLDLVFPLENAPSANCVLLVNGSELASIRTASSTQRGFVKTSFLPQGACVWVEGALLIKPHLSINPGFCR